MLLKKLFIKINLLKTINCCDISKYDRTFYFGHNSKFNKKFITKSDL